MRMSHLFGRTLREAPGDVELPSHRLMLRAALMRPLGAGTAVYWNGAFGDASPAVPSRDFASAQALGTAVATATLAAMQTPTLVGPGVHLAWQPFVQCVTNPSFVYIQRERV